MVFHRIKKETLELTALLSRKSQSECSSYCILQSMPAQHSVEWGWSRDSVGLWARVARLPIETASARLLRVSKELQQITLNIVPQ